MNCNVIMISRKIELGYVKYVQMINSHIDIARNCHIYFINIGSLNINFAFGFYTEIDSARVEYDSLNIGTEIRKG